MTWPPHHVAGQQDAEERIFTAFNPALGDILVLPVDIFPCSHMSC